MHLLRMIIITKRRGYATLSLDVLVYSYEQERQMAATNAISWSADWLNWVQQFTCLRTMRIAISFITYYYSIKFRILITTDFQACFFCTLFY